MIRLHTEQGLILDRDYIKDIVALDKSISDENVFYIIENGSFRLCSNQNLSGFITHIYNKLRTSNKAKSHLKISFIEDNFIKNTSEEDYNNIIDELAFYSEKHNVTIYVADHSNEPCEDLSLGLECVHFHIIYEEPTEENLTEYLLKKIY